MEISIKEMTICARGRINESVSAPNCWIHLIISAENAEIMEVEEKIHSNGYGFLTKIKITKPKVIFDKITNQYLLGDQKILIRRDAVYGEYSPKKYYNVIEVDRMEEIPYEAACSNCKPKEEEKAE